MAWDLVFFRVGGRIRSIRGPGPPGLSRRTKCRFGMIEFVT